MSNVTLSTLRGQQVMDLLAEDRLMDVPCYEKFPGKRVKNPGFQEHATADHRRDVPVYRREKLEG